MKYFLIILSILLLIGGGILIWYFNRGNNSDSSQNISAPSDTTEAISSQTNESNTVASTDSSGTTNGTFTDLLAYGQPAMCSWHAADEAAGQLQEGDGTFYTDGVSRGRAQAVFTVEELSVPFDGIFIDNDVYYWQTVSGTTLGLKLSQDSLDHSFADLTPEEQASAASIRNDYNFNCQPWTVDESMFELPSDVNFIEI